MSAAETLKAGQAMGELLRPGDIVALKGRLGAGKTVFAKGIAKGLGCRNHVKSPSFVLINIYQGTIPMYHIDFYRLKKTSDLHDLGLEEFLCGTGVSVVEWAQKFPNALPRDHISVEIVYSGRDERDIEVMGKGVRPKGVIEHYAHCPEIRRNIRRKS